MLQSTAARVPRRAPRPHLRHDLPRRASTAVHRQSKTGALPPPKFMYPGKRTLQGKFLNFVPTVAHTMAALRAIEQKYGRVADFKFMRDYVVPSNYQLWFHVTFYDSLPALPQDETTIHIASPEVNIYREGGISLEELLPHALSNGSESGRIKFLDVEALTELEMQVAKPISFVLYRKTEYAIHPAVAPRYQSKPLDVSRSFLKWGGFHNIQKMEPRKIEDIELFSNETSATDHIRMYRVLQKHAGVLGIRSPSEIRREIPSPPAPNKWESIPEPEDSSAVPEDPSETIQTAVSNSQEQPNKQTKPQPGTAAVSKQPKTTSHMVASMLRDIKFTEDDIANKNQVVLPSGDSTEANVPKVSTKSAQAAAVAQNIRTQEPEVVTKKVVTERDPGTEEARFKRAAEAEARVKAAELEAAARMKVAKVAAGKTKLKGQLRSAERAALKVSSKKKDVTQTAGTKTAGKGSQFKPSYRLAPTAAAKKMEMKVVKEEKSTGFAGKVASFFKFGG